MDQSSYEQCSEKEKNGDIIKIQIQTDQGMIFFLSPEVIDATQSLFSIDHVEIDDGVYRYGHGIASKNLSLVKQFDINYLRIVGTAFQFVTVILAINFKLPVASDLKKLPLVGGRRTRPS